MASGTEPLVNGDGEPHDVAARRRALVLLFAVCFGEMFGSSLSAPAVPYYARQFGASNAEIGYLFGCWSASSTIGTPIIGRFADIYGRKRAIMLALIGGGLAALGQGMAHTWQLFFLCRGLAGGCSCVVTMSQIYLGDVCEASVMPKYMARLSGAPGAAMIFGPIFGGLIAKIALHYPILVDGGLSIVLACLLFFFLPESPGWLANHSVKRSPSSATNGPRYTPIPRRAYLCGLSGFLLGISFSSTSSMLAVSLNAKHGFGVQEVGYTMTCMAVVMFFVSMCATPKLQRRFGLFPVATFGTATGGIVISGVLAAHTAVASIAFMALSRVGSTLRMSSNGALHATFSDSTNRGRVFGRLLMCRNLGQMVGPFAAGLLAEIDPVSAPWALASVAAVLSAAVLACCRPPDSYPKQPLAGSVDIAKDEDPDFVPLRRIATHPEDDLALMGSVRSPTSPTGGSPFGTELVMGSHLDGSATPRTPVRASGDAKAHAWRTPGVNALTPRLDPKRGP